MPFNNDIAGGNGSLVRNQLQSPGFTAGVTGWIIRKDGTVEFNNGTFRGTLTSGSNPGKHIVLNDVLGTGDAIDVYNNANLIVFSVDNNGVLRSIDRSGGGNTFALNAAGQVWNNNNTPAFVSADLAFSILGGAFPKSVLSALSGQVASGDSQSSIDLVSGAGANAGSIHVLQRGVNGHIIQSDTGGVGANPTNNLFHVFHGTATTVNNAGFVTATFNHGATFTPTGQIIVPFDGASVTNLYTYNMETVNATQVVVSVRHADGTLPAAGESTECWGIVFA